MIKNRLKLKKNKMFNLRKNRMTHFKVKILYIEITKIWEDIKINIINNKNNNILRISSSE